MAIYAHRRLIFSLRQPFQSNFNYIYSIYRPYSPSLHFRSSSFSSTSALRKSLSSFNLSQLKHDFNFRGSFNGGVRSFATRLSESSSRNNGPPKETIMLEGCDFEHWLVVVENPDPQLTRDDIIDGYIKTLAQIIGSEEEARMKIYAVSTRHYFAFSALISEELSYKLKELPNVKWVLPDSYMDVKNKTYAGEPFINGQPVPYDPKYHEIWVRNHAESQRNKNRSSRRPRDPNSRSRSPTSVSARDNSNQNWISEPNPQNQALQTQTSNRHNQTSQPSSLSGPGNHQQNQISSVDSLNEAARSSQLQMPPRWQSQVQNQAPPTYSQNQAPPTYSQNQAPLAYSQNQAPPTYAQNKAPLTYAQNHQAPSTYAQNHQAPPTYAQNQQAPPTYFQNQQAPPTYSQNHQTPSIYPQNQALQPSLVHNHSMPTTPPPPLQHSGSMNRNSHGWGGQSHSWAPPEGSTNQARHPSHMLNQTPPRSSASNSYDPANVQSQSQKTATRYQSHPPQPPSPEPSNLASKNPYLVALKGLCVEGEYQSRSSQPQTSNSYMNDNISPSAPAGDMPNTNFYGGSMPSNVQQNNYPFRDIPRHAQSVGSSNGHPSQSLQQQQYQDSHRTYRDMPSSTSMVPPAPARDMPSHMWNPNLPRWDVPADVQQNGYSGNISHVQNGGAHTGRYPPHTFQD
ncbi:hypothetical protein SOVF_068540 [Spinacia oleracea]|uniref:Multiple organellar RNA editing factor 8, chloroplastic/mitochondrial-like n=1 Tax=Spinacia oleracea TaxID=3562 RepID=A0A9R0K1M2_SPIOL|nr:multiple organellar RNA editing factor 8, chloroplastic/mitochondrial-like [Spinacia oleracea]KNA18677.1 hypothetical protein SOVF_068540 [Spinacia oleracea]